MPFQPIVVTLEQAEIELRPYIVRRRPIIHRAFDPRLGRLETAMGDPLIEANNQLNEVIRLLNLITSIAVTEKNFLLRQIRGTTNPLSGSAQQRRSNTRNLPRQDQATVSNWMSREQVRHMLFCLLPYINHKIIMNVGTGTGMNADCSLNTDPFEVVRLIHHENQIISTISVNYHNNEQTVALRHYVGRLQNVINLLNSFIANAVIRESAESAATNFILQQQGRTTQNLEALINRISATRQTLSSRYGNILRNAATIQYARDPIRNHDPDPVIDVPTAGIRNVIDNPSGVIINWNHPDLIPIKHLPGSSRIFSDPIDIMFAVAMTRFLKHIKATLYVFEVYSEGFIRNPLGLDDPHPFGRSCDVTGFGVNTVAFQSPVNSTPQPAVLHLRSGYPVTNLRGGHHSRNASLFDYGHGPSDWFNIARLDEYVYREELRAGVVIPPTARSRYLRRIVESMSSFFGFVKGPGSNLDHMDHFHLDLARFSVSSPAFDYPATILNPTPFIPEPRTRQPMPASNRRQMR